MSSLVMFDDVICCHLNCTRYDKPRHSLAGYLGMAGVDSILRAVGLSDDTLLVFSFVTQNTRLQLAILKF